MLRLTQIIRNLFLRVEGFLSVVFKSFLGFVKSFFGFFARLFGFTKSDYFLESNEAQGIKQTSAKESIQTDQNKTLETTANNRRRSNTKMDDYYLNMARDLKKK
ncbi:threonine dehydratase [Nostocaceae cyanobacterium CENA357]|uniref:Threonine dehydratase n=1 Tax=Atlanticothrix silvestris CENA357 TaxID=1725252 RepID=A0A8J7HHV4_9CYAN|nr:threonine dehydratase [Atlanticothrix silvestris]MBH8553219.1 threonine dehydratase [Atlanticothrix silvestris CENA357]